MINEDYVSFETAKLLNEKGFDWNCETKRFYPEPDYDQESPNGVYAPTLQIAMKWLREVHNIHIVIKSAIRTYGNTEYYYELYGTKNKSLCVVCDIYKGESWDSSEEATEAAIKYCLENFI